MAWPRWSVAEPAMCTHPSVRRATTPGSQWRVMIRAPRRVDWFHEDRDLVRRGVSVVLRRQAPPRTGTGAVRPPGRGRHRVEGVRARPARATATRGELPRAHRTEVRHLRGTGS